MNSCKKHEGNGFSRVATAFVLFFVVLVTGFFAYRLFFAAAPLINGTEAFSSLPAEKTVTLVGKNIGSVEISINQGGRVIELLKDAAGGKEKTYTIKVRPKELGLSDGGASVVVFAEAGMFKKLKQDVNVVIDTTPPSLEALKTPETVNQGGAGFAVLRAKKAGSVFVELEGEMYPAFPVTAGTEGAADYYVFFPVPFNVKEGSVLHAVAMDAAGNRNVLSFHTSIKTTPYRSSDITIEDTFIKTVASSLLNETGISDPEAAFKKVNEELRANALAKLKDIAKQTEPKRLWDGAFLQMKNSKVMAVYGDKRAYLYKGRTISRSVHLGYDLASNAHAPVEAANSGLVRFAGDLGIYGNAVIIDHGMGLMSLYGHMSVINVSEGQKVGKGDIIGKSGSTGLAGGDHLHFGILIHGHEVSPLFWWDRHWISVNVFDEAAG
ncbi:MAG: M23 family metallopeptidase [Nitrospirae bacterium]|nr:M23 family metallopeptidase [Nitrospirota bacterium]